jgi:Tfp pilus assembly protein PilW
MNLWLIPASDEAAQTNIPKTLSAEISAERASKAGILGNLHAWGAKASSDSNVNKFAKMAAGDSCLF